MHLIVKAAYSNYPLILAFRKLKNDPFYQIIIEELYAKPTLVRPIQWGGTCVLSRLKSKQV